MNLQKRLRKALAIRKISIYKLAEDTGIKYELLRRSINGNRKLSAEELILILNSSGINFGEINK